MADEAARRRGARLDQLHSAGEVPQGGFDPPPVLWHPAVMCDGGNDGGVTVHADGVMSFLGLGLDAVPEAAPLQPVGGGCGEGRRGNGTVSVNVDALVRASAAGDAAILELMVDSGALLDAHDAGGIPASR